MITPIGGENNPRSRLTRLAWLGGFRAAPALQVHKEVRECIRLVQTPVAVEKGTKAVISANSSVYGERTFNDFELSRLGIQSASPTARRCPTQKLDQNRNRF